MKNYLIYGQLMLVIMMWGLNVVAIKVIVGEFSPVTITSFRIFLASVFVFIVLLFRKQIRMPKKKEWLYIGLVALTGVAGHHFFLSVGLTQASASTSGLILGLVPLFTAILASLMLKERLSFLRLAGLVFGLSGVSLVVLVGSSEGLALNTGDLFVFFAVLAQAVSFIFIKKATETMGARLVTGITLMLGSFFLFIISLFMEPDGLSSLLEGSLLGWTVFLASALFATALGQFLYNHAIQHIGPGKSSIFMNLQPFFALLGSYFFLGEQLSVVHFLGFILIVIGVMLGSGMADEWVRRRAAERT